MPNGSQANLPSTGACYRTTLSVQRSNRSILRPRLDGLLRIFFAIMLGVFCSLPNRSCPVVVENCSSVRNALTWDVAAYQQTLQLAMDMYLGATWALKTTMS